MRVFERVATRRNQKVWVMPTLFDQSRTLKVTYCGMNVYLLASERSERDTIRGVQIRAGAVYIYIYYIGA